MRRKFHSVFRSLAPLFLMAPMIVGLGLFFGVPLGNILVRAVASPEVAIALPETDAALAGWDTRSIPDETVFSALHADLVKSYADKTIADAANRINLQESGMRSLMMKTARRADGMENGSSREFAAIDDRWAELTTWRAIHGVLPRYTPEYLLRVLDMERSFDGTLRMVPKDQRIYLQILARTLWMGAVVTVICLMIGFPMAYTISALPGMWSGLMLIGVLLPFWMSLLVRTGAWVVLLQREGMVNTSLMDLGVIDGPLQLMFNRAGVYVAMVHVLLPFMILPIYSVMKGISNERIRAAQSLGATPLRAFVSVYLPDTLPGVGAGILLVFVLAIGFYITPALIGGSNDQMLSYLIAQLANKNANFGLASALAILLMIPVLGAVALVMRWTRLGMGTGK